jgi:four helix bundle protein
MHNYKELKVWQKAMDLVVDVYSLTREFPKDELFGLTSQLRRAAVSIALNIAEGAGCESDLEFARMTTGLIRKLAPSREYLQK